jgi:hypothetical protein
MLEFAIDGLFGVGKMTQTCHELKSRGKKLERSLLGKASISMHACFLIKAKEATSTKESLRKMDPKVCMHAF